MIIVNTLFVNCEQNLTMQNSMSVTQYVSTAIDTAENHFKQHCTATVTSEDIVNRHTVDVSVHQLRQSTTVTQFYCNPNRHRDCERLWFN